MTDEHKPLTAAEIEDLRKLEAKATPGPWAFGPYGDENKYGVGVVMDENDEPIVGLDETDDGIVVESVAPEVDGYANAALIAAMRNALPALLRVVEAAARAREVRSWSKVPRQVHAGESWQELDAALTALEARCSESLTRARSWPAKA